MADIVNSAPETLDTLKELSDALGNDPNFATTVTTQIGKKVDKVSGKQLSTNDYTTAEKTKLAGIATGANNYTHPSTHPASVIVQDATHRFATDAEKTKWDSKAEGSHNHDTSYAPRTLRAGIYTRFTVDGDANKYYPVSINNDVTAFGSQRLSISRQYGWKAPDTWNTATHKGGLTLGLVWNGDKYWGGNGTDQYSVEMFDETYSTMVGGLGMSVNGIVVWLRGGGALYQLDGEYGASLIVNVHLEGLTDDAGNKFPVRTTPIQTEVTNRYSNRKGILYDGGTRVYSPLNKPSQADVGLSNVNNTSDLNKPISTATQTALDGKADKSHSHSYLPTSGGRLSGNLNIVNRVFTGSVYSYEEGILIKTNIPESSNVMVDMRIMGNSYGSSLNIDTKVQLYNYGDKGITNYSAIANGVVFPVYAFRMGGILCLWLKQTSAYQTFRFDIGTSLHDNLTVTIHRQAKPTTGVTNEVTIYPISSYNTSRKPTKADVGLSNVDNTSDLNKPISTATQTALNDKANTSHGNHVPTLQTANNAVFLRNDNKWVTIIPENIGASRGDRVSATTPTTAGWYRFAESPVSINNNIAEFDIVASVSGVHSVIKLTASISYNKYPAIQQNIHSYYSEGGITKARIVYGTEYSDNKAFLELYKSGDKAMNVVVSMIGSTGWTLISPDTVGSVPSGYGNKEITLAPNRIVADINGMVNGFTIEKSVPSNAVFTDTVYTHPSTHPATIVTQDATHRFVSDTEKSTWNGKANASHTHTIANITGLQGEIDSLKSSVSSGKNAIASSITAKGVSATGSEEFSSLAGKINQLYGKNQDIITESNLFLSGLRAFKEIGISSSNGSMTNLFNTSFGWMNFGYGTSNTRKMINRNLEPISVNNEQLYTIICSKYTDLSIPKIFATDIDYNYYEVTPIVNGEMRKKLINSVTDKYNKYLYQNGSSVYYAGSFLYYVPNKDRTSFAKMNITGSSPIYRVIPQAGVEVDGILYVDTVEDFITIGSNNVGRVISEAGGLFGQLNLPTTMSSIEKSTDALMANRTEHGTHILYFSGDNTYKRINSAFGVVWSQNKSNFNNIATSKAVALTRCRDRAIIGNKYVNAINGTIISTLTGFTPTTTQYIQGYFEYNGKTYWTGLQGANYQTKLMEEVYRLK